MNKIRVLIVGRTVMRGGICIGAVDIAAPNRSIRLLDSSGAHQPTSAAYQVGDVWDIECIPSANLVAPHTEDALVSKAAFGYRAINIDSWIKSNVRISSGSPSAVFGGALFRTGDNAAFISPANIPAYSTCFWIPDKDLIQGANHRGKTRFEYREQSGLWGFSWVGTQALAPVIPAQTLVRLSLARWWRPDGSVELEERCYAQLSGWF